MAVSQELSDHIDAILDAAGTAVKAKVDAEIIKDRPTINLRDHLVEAVKVATGAEDLSDLSE
jgi:hypothetical protein